MTIKPTTNISELIHQVETLPSELQKDIFAYVDFLKMRHDTYLSHNSQNSDNLLANVFDDLSIEDENDGQNLPLVDSALLEIEIGIDYDDQDIDDIFVNSLRKIDPKALKKIEKEKRTKERFLAFREKQEDEVQNLDTNWQTMVCSKEDIQFSNAQMRHHFKKWYITYKDVLQSFDKEWTAQQLGRKILDDTELKQVFQELFIKYGNVWCNLTENTNQSPNNAPSIIDETIINDIQTKFHTWRKQQQHILSDNYQRWQGSNNKEHTENMTITDEEHQQQLTAMYSQLNDIDESVEAICDKALLKEIDAKQRYLAWKIQQDQ